MLLFDSTMSPTSSIANPCFQGGFGDRRWSRWRSRKEQRLFPKSFPGVTGAALAAWVAWPLPQSSFLENETPKISLALSFRGMCQAGIIALWPKAGLVLALVAIGPGRKNGDGFYFALPGPGLRNKPIGTSLISA